MTKFVAFVVAVAACALTAAAHMGLTPEEAQIDEQVIVTLRIGHDCGDDTIGTTNFTIVLPPRLPDVSVEQPANWRVIIHKEVADPPINTGHGFADEWVRAVTYLGFLPDDFYQLFNLRIRMPHKVGKVLWFKGYQDCHNQGTSIEWDQIPSKKDPDPRYPARGITLVNCTHPEAHHR